MKRYNLFTPLLGLLFSVCAIYAQKNQPFNPNERIDIEQNSIHTVLYPDKQNPYSDFWYLPGNLSIERKKVGGRSRLSFSLELHQSKDQQKPDYVQFEMVISPGYPEAYEKMLKNKLTEMGRTVVDPLNPEESYKALNLHPISYRIKQVIFDDLFPTAELVNRDTFKKRDIRLDRSFPVRFRLNHYDASILLESLLKKRNYRVAKIETESGDYVPVYLNLDIPDSEMPLDYAIEQNNQQWQMSFSNPTEQPILLDGFTYFSPKQRNWVSVNVSDTIAPFLEDLSTAPQVHIKLTEKPGEIKEVRWRALPNYQEILNFYIKNRTPAPPLRLRCISGSQKSELLSALKEIKLHVRMTDGLGLLHTRTFLLLSDSAQDIDQSFVLSGFFGERDLQYSISGRLKEENTQVWSSWVSHSTALLGGEVTLLLEKMAESLILININSGLVRVGEVFVNHGKMGAEVIPARVEVYKNHEENLMMQEIRASNGKIEGFVELFAPVLPANIESVKQILGASTNFRATQAQKVIVTLKIGDLVLVKNQVLSADSRKHVSIRFSANGEGATQIMRTIKEDNTPIVVTSIWYWNTTEGIIPVLYNTFMKLN